MKKSKFFFLINKAVEEIEQSKDKGKKYTFHINWPHYINTARSENISTVDVYAALKFLIETAIKHKVDLLLLSTDKTYMSVGRA